MLWLVIALLASLAVLLVAAAGLVRHIRLQRVRQKPGPTEAPEPADETDVESGS